MAMAFLLAFPWKASRQRGVSDLSQWQWVAAIARLAPKCTQVFWELICFPVIQALSRRAGTLPLEADISSFLSLDFLLHNAHIPAGKTDEREISGTKRVTGPLC